MSRKNQPASEEIFARELFSKHYTILIESSDGVRMTAFKNLQSVHTHAPTHKEKNVSLKVTLGLRFLDQVGICRQRV